MPNSFVQMTANGNYPNTNGVSVSPLAFTQCLMHYSLIIGGTPGTSPSFQPQVQKTDGTWVNVGTPLTAIGEISGSAYGKAMRCVATVGTTPGTGVNTPKMFLFVDRRNVNPTKASAG